MVGEAATFKDYGNLVEAVNALLRPRLMALGKQEVSAIRQDISIKCYGQHSPPGHPPYREKGKLTQGIGYRIVRRGGALDSLELKAQRTNERTGDPKIAIYLELGTRYMAKRPFMARSLARVTSSATTSLGKT